MVDVVKKSLAKEYRKVLCIPPQRVLDMTQKGGLLYGVRRDTLCLTRSDKGVKKNVRYFFAEKKDLLCLVQVAPNEKNTLEVNVIAYKARVKT